MKKALLALLGLALILASTGAEAASKFQKSPQTRFRKLSLHLRGKVPSDAEYEALGNAVMKKEEKAFFDSSIKDFLQSKEHVGKMQVRLHELFRMRTFGGLPEEVGTFSTYNFNYEDQKMRPENSSFDGVIASMVEKNESWDQLLLAKRYRVKVPPLNTGDGRVSDQGFFNDVVEGGILGDSRDGYLRDMKEQMFTEDGYTLSIGEQSQDKEISFGADDARIAGTLTTSRFTSRFNTTLLNQNRRRAAAVFRIFLCDEMRPAIVPSAAEDSELLSTATQDVEESAGQDAGVKHVSMMKDKHGTDPVCMSCHYKLDPMGKAFMGMDAVLQKKETPGALVFKREDGTLVSIKGRGIGDVAKAITQQPEYAACQVQHFWNWFIGKDVPLSGKRREELTKKFDELGRKTNDFIAYLVSQPEFYVAPEMADAKARGAFLSARKFLSSCVACHRGLPVDEGTRGIPDFTRLPIQGDGRSHKDWVAAIAEELDLLNDGAQRLMPPAKAGWSADDVNAAVKAVKAWICQGAPDEMGKRTLEAQDLPQGACKK